MIELKFYTGTAAEQAQVAQYPLADPTYTATPQATVAQADKQRQPVLLLEKGQLVGFCALFSQDAVTYLGGDPATTVVLRSVSVADQHRGQGIAKRGFSQLPAFVQAYFPAATEIVLAVAPENTVAYRLYTQLGYVATGRQLDWQGELLDVLRYPLH